jgi:hypothetical protein
MKLITLAALLLVAVTTSAQLKVPKTSNGNGSIGNLITQFTNQLKPASFTNAWNGQKGNFLSSAGKIADAVSVGKSVSSLVGFLKPDMFKQGFNIQNLLSAANTVNTMSQAAGLLKNLEGGLKPEAFSSGWSQKRSGWLNALNLIK